MSNKDENFITLIVITVGEDIEESFNVHQPMRVVKNRALEVSQAGADPNQFVLEYDGQPLDDKRKIEEYVAEFNWTDGTKLRLRPRPEVI